MSKLSSTKDKTVRFKNPSRAECAEGRVLDEVWAKAPRRFSSLGPYNYGWGQNAFLAQLIEWDGTKRVRFTYHHRSPKGNSTSWRFGGQFAAMMSLE
jgi:hypothetical protein